MGAPTSWRYETGVATLPEVYRTLRVPEAAGFFRKALAFAGPGFLGWIKALAWAVAFLIGGLNAWLLLQTVRDWLG